MPPRRSRLLVIILILAVFMLFIGYLSLPKNQKPAVAETVNTFLFAIVNDDLPAKDRLQVLSYTAADAKSKELLSIVVPEDTSAEIIGAGYSHIRNAYYFGGLSLTSKSAGKLLGIKDGGGYYISLDTQSLSKLIDVCGGIQIKPDAQTLNGQEVAQALMQAGAQHNPEAYANIVQSIFEKLLEEHNGLDYLQDMLASKDSHTSTNIASESLAGLVAQIKLLGRASAIVLPGEKVREGKVVDWVPDQNKLADLKKTAGKYGLASGIKALEELAAEKKSVHRQADNKPPAEVPQVAEATATAPFTVTVLNSAGIQGLASRGSQLLTSKGFIVGAMGNLSSLRYNSSVVLYMPGFKEQAQDIAALLSIARIAPATSADLSSINSKSEVVVILGKDSKLAKPQ